MKKKKLLLPIAVMTLSCGLAAGILTGCGGHEHNYTEYGHDDTGHWQICVEDGEKSEKKDHVFGADDKCACGAEKPAYGTASGRVKLFKLGEYVEDYTGVTVDTGDDDGIEIDYNSATGEFEITNARVGKSYNLTISKTGYLSYSTTLEVIKGENSVIGGSTGCVLQYDAFTHGTHNGNDWSGNYGDTSKIDKSHVNDENPYFTINEGAGDFYVYTKDSYNTVTASVTYKDGVTWGCSDGHPDERGNQGLRLVFEDGKAVMIRIEKMPGGSVKAQWVGSQDWEDAPILDKWDFGTDEAHYNPFGSELDTKYKEEGVELKLVRNGSAVYAYVDGQKAGEQFLPEEYATQKCRVVLAAAHVNGGSIIPFSIKKEIPAEAFESTVTLDKTNVPETAGLSVELDQTSYKLGDKATLNITLPDEDYIVSALTLNGANMLDKLENGKLSFVVSKAENTVSVTIVQKQYVDLSEVSVTGKKYDVTGNSLPETVTGTLVGKGGLGNVEITVENGKFSKDHVAQGTYTANFAGYKPVDVVVGADGIVNGITLEYDGFEMLPPNYDASIHDLSQVNDGIIKVNGAGKQSLDIVTKDTFTDVAVTINVKDSAAGVIQGIVLKFENGKYVLFNFKKDQTNVQYRPDCWGMKSVFNPEGGEKWIEHAITAADIAKFESAEGIELQLIRKGGMLYSFVGGRFIAADALPEGYATQKAQVGFFAFDVKANASWNYTISETLPSLASAVQVDVDKPTGATEASVTANKNSCTLGDTVELTVNCPAGFILTKLQVNGRDLGGALDNGKVSFVADMATMTVTVEFVAGELKEVEIDASGIGLNNSAVDLNGKELTIQLKGSAARYKATVQNGKISAELPVGKPLVVSLDGYYDCEVTVPTEGTVEDGISLSKVIFKYNIINEAGINNGNSEVDNTTAAKDGYITTTKDCKVYEWMLEKYADAAFSVTLKKGNGNQGIFMMFEDSGKMALRLRIDEENNRLEWVSAWNNGGSWWPWEWGTQTFINGVFNIGDGENYGNPIDATKYQNEGVKLTMLRKGSMAYVLVDGEIFGATVIAPDYANKKVQFAVWAAGAKAGYQIPFEVTSDVDAMLNANKLEETEFTGVIGKWTKGETAGTVKVTGKGYAEILPASASTNASLSLNIAASLSNAGKKAQGITYRFADGRWFAIRIESSTAESYIQYSEDALVPAGGGCLKGGWGLVGGRKLTEDEVTAFNGTGLTLTLERNGNTFTVKLGGTVLDTFTLDDQYANMSGVFGITEENGTGEEIVYAYTDNSVAVPEESAE